MTRQQTVAIVGAVAALVVVGVLAGGVGASSSASSASPHGAENGNYTVSLPFDTDHYPRDENPGGPYNASINQFAAGTQESYDQVGAPDGFEQMKYLEIENQDIDFSECSSSNTAAFGIDRDNDNTGTNVDLDLLRYLEQSTFNPHSIQVDFYEGDELGAPGPDDRGGKESGREDGDGNAELYPDDEIVSHQGYRSGGGPCYGMPEEPGWYQIEGFTNGTSWGGDDVKVETISHYFYICVCDSEEEAIEKLGKRPSKQGDGSTDGGSEQTSTVTATATPTPTPESGDDGGSSEATATDSPTPTPTATPTDSPTPTATDSPTPTPTDSPTPTPESGSDAESSGGGGGGGGGGGSTATATASGDGGSGGSNQQQNQQVQQNQQGAGPATPTVGSGPGFGVIAALGGLLAAALLAFRRD